MDSLEEKRGINETSVLDLLNSINSTANVLGDTRTAQEMRKKLWEFLCNRYLKQYSDEELSLLVDLEVPNLSPESRGNEGMRDFIVKHLPNNPET